MPPMTRGDIDIVQQIGIGWARKVNGCAYLCLTISRIRGDFGEEMCVCRKTRQNEFLSNNITCLCERVYYKRARDERIYTFNATSSNQQSSPECTNFLKHYLYYSRTRWLQIVICSCGVCVCVCRHTYSSSVKEWICGRFMIAILV